MCLVNIENLNSIKKRFSFLNPSWAALKYFDEQQFLKIVQGQGTINSSQVLGRLPRKLNLPAQAQPPQLQHSRSKSQNSSSSVVTSPPASLLSRTPSTTIQRQSSTSSNAKYGNSVPSLRPRSSSQSQHQLYTSSRVDALKQHQPRPSSSNSNLKNRYPAASPTPERRNTAHSPQSSISKSQSSTTPVSSEKNMKSLEGLLFEHFTYGGEDIQLFSGANQPATTASSPHPTSRSHSFASAHASVSTAATIERKDLNTKRESPQPMTYDKDFQLSPPPPKRRASLTTTFSSLSCYDSKQAVKLTRSPSFSSIIQNI